MRSLERHLLAWVLGALSLGAMLLVLASYLVTLDEMSEVFDDNLRQVALALADSREALQRGDAAQRHAALPKVYEEHGDFDFTTAVWDLAGNRLSISGPNANLPFSAASGLSRIGKGEQAWHVYTIVSGDRVVQAAQRASSRRLLAAEAASKLLIPVLGLTLLIGGLLVVALRRGLRPLDTAANDVAVRSAVSLDPIDTAGVPLEIHPLIRSINGLMQRLAEAFTVQRQFIADAAHELRSPVTALRLQLQLLERVQDEAGRTRAIGELKLGVERTQRLIAQLLDLSRVDPDGRAQLRQPVDLAELAQAAVVKRSVEAEHKGIDLGADAPATVTIDADPDQLAVLLDNLIGNAIRYTSPGGRVDVRVARLEGRPMLQVIDNGPGIAEAERERVLDRFYRGEARQRDGDVPGSGLGLAIVSAIAQRHGAQLSLRAAAPLGGLEARVVFAT
ncbi:ATP-binding protein [Variovorax sp. PBL-E5]|uniref:ATP-binding protein n=1 Tax=Variovorax sp. PBL-E5 TaxID=434014 RepID=UPI001317003A|nr:ATP-binding protein [Variovorax sp. PBL-E5]VTU34195.1 Sensor protein QseC [Variovorax sp. PBL-E5]